MEEDLKIFKVEYLSNHWTDFTQILNLSLGDKTKIKDAWTEDDHSWKRTTNGRQPPPEEDIKIFKVKYLSNHWSDFPLILYLSSGDQTKIKNA